MGARETVDCGFHPARSEEYTETSAGDASSLRRSPASGTFALCATSPAEVIHVERSRRPRPELARLGQSQ